MPSPWVDRWSAAVLQERLWDLLSTGTFPLGCSAQLERLLGRRWDRQVVKPSPRGTGPRMPRLLSRW